MFCKLWVFVVLMPLSSLIFGIVAVIRILCGCRILKPDLADDNACLMIDLIPLLCISEQVRLSSRYLLFLLLLLLFLLIRVALFLAPVFGSQSSLFYSSNRSHVLPQCDSKKQYWAVWLHPSALSLPTYSLVLPAGLLLPRLISRIRFGNLLSRIIITYPSHFQYFNTCARYQFIVYISYVHFCIVPYSPGAWGGVVVKALRY